MFLMKPARIVSLLFHRHEIDNQHGIIHLICVQKPRLHSSDINLGISGVCVLVSCHYQVYWLDYKCRLFFIIDTIRLNIIHRYLIECKQFPLTIFIFFIFIYNFLSKIWICYISYWWYVWNVHWKNNAKHCQRLYWHAFFRYQIIRFTYNISPG